MATEKKNDSLFGRLSDILNPQNTSAFHSDIQTKAVFYINETRFELPEIEPETTLADFIRGTGLTGTKQGCNEGGCGACTVMLSHWDHETQSVVHRGVASCLLPLLFVNNMVVTTVEGVGSMKKGLHPIQEKLAANHATQCGFCTPGIVMSLYSAVSENPEPSVDDIEDYIAGNLCRCTGYRPIVETAHSFAKDNTENKSELTEASEAHANLKHKKHQCPDCPNKGKDHKHEEAPGLIWEENKAYAPIPFPEELKIAPRDALISGKYSSWFCPVSLKTLLSFKAHEISQLDVEVMAGKTRCTTFKGVELVCGNTDLGFKKKYHPTYLPRLLVSLNSVQELRFQKFDDKGMTVGAGSTISQFERFCKSLTGKVDENKLLFAKAFAYQVRWFANKMVRNVGTLGGSLCAADPLSDLYPIWLASNSVVTITSPTKGTFTVPVREFVVSPKTTVLEKDEIVVSIFTPWSDEHSAVESYKTAKRRDDCQAMVNGCMHLQLTPDHSKIADCWIAYGGVGKSTVSCHETRKFLIGKAPTSQVFHDAIESISKEINVLPSLSYTELRQSLIRGLFFKFIVSAASRLQFAKVTDKLKSAQDKWKHPHREFHQDFPRQDLPTVDGKLPKGEKKALAATCKFSEVAEDKHTPAVKGTEPEIRKQIGRPVPHQSAFMHATGEAIYTGDIPLPNNGLYAAPVLSQQAHAKLLSVDPSAALALPGVHAFISAKDIPAGGQTKLGTLVEDENIFADDEVHFFGQVIGLIVADSHNLALEAANEVQKNIKYEPLPAILSLEEAIEKKSFFPGWDREIAKGDMEKAFAECDYVTEGEVFIGAQDHFYIEPQNCLVIPGVDGYTVYAASQNPSKMQDAVAKVLNIPLNAVVSKVMRLGGGFGGKQDRPQFQVAQVAVACHVTGRPVRLVLERTDDLAITGMRHPYLGKYKIGLKKDGSIHAYHVDAFTNGGWTLDLTSAQLDRGLWSGEGCYLIPNIKLNGFCCRTNMISNTAYRGFGVPQLLAMIETAIEHVSTVAGLDSTMVREKNLYKAKDLTTTDYQLPDCTVRMCWDQLLQTSEYKKRKEEVDKFNAENTFIKRGLAVMPCRSSSFFESDFMDAGGSLVQIYRDGTVHVSHGGVEMGQGLHTKMAMIAAETLGIDYELIHTGSSDTDKVANTHPTAASSGTDLNGWAVFDACKQLNKFLAPLRQANPDATWQEIVKMAYFNKVRLQATGYFRGPDFLYDYGTKQGRTSYYFVWSSILVEVEIDMLSGDLSLNRVDMVQDCGNSLNPAIDIGQLEGAFIQGYGLFTMEEPIWANDGHLRTRNVSTYKIPGAGDIPKNFNVSLLKNVPNKCGGVYNQKTMGEIGIQCGFAAHLAVRDAIRNFKAANNDKEFFRLDTPATLEKIMLTAQATSNFPDLE